MGDGRDISLTGSWDVVLPRLKSEIDIKIYCHWSYWAKPDAISLFTPCIAPHVKQKRKRATNP